jgi:hypothetical protein
MNPSRDKEIEIKIVYGGRRAEEEKIGLFEGNEKKCLEEREGRVKGKWGRLESGLMINQAESVTRLTEDTGCRASSQVPESEEAQK